MNNPYDTGKENYKRLNFIFTFLENRDLLNEEGEDELAVLSEHSSLQPYMVNRLGKQMLDKYYSKWKNTNDNFNLSESESFWNRRFLDINTYNKANILHESSFIADRKNYYMEKDLDFYLESLDYNIPCNAKSVLLECEYNKGDLVLHATAYNEFNSPINDLGFSKLSENRIPNIIFDKEEVQSLDDLINPINECFNNIRDIWMSKERVNSNKNIILNLDELNLSTEL